MHTLDWEADMSRKPKTSDNPMPILEEEEMDAEMPPPPPKRGPPKNEAMLAAIGIRVIEIRKSMNMSQTQLARASDVPTSTVFSVENGQHNTSLSTLQKIADALKLDMRDLMPGTSAPPATGQGIAMLKLVESSLQTTLNELNRSKAMFEQEMNRTTTMLDHILKMVIDMQDPNPIRRRTGH